MPSQVLELKDVLYPDNLATRITEKWMEWDMMRQLWKQDREEVRRYVYATDTTHTSNAALPWKNKTTIPKLCQISDNLFSNYTATLFPQRKWLEWEANEKDANSVHKRDSITNYMLWAIAQPSFKEEIYKTILDYIQDGNCFVTPIWIDERVKRQDGSTQMGYIGPGARRINPMDTVMNPTAESYIKSPKVIRSITSLGEIKKLLEQMSNDENREEYKKLWNYLRDIRHTVNQYHGDIIERDNLYSIDGFGSFRQYLASEAVEVLTFYGDLYDPDNDEFLENHVIMVVDRHKLISKKPNPSWFGYPPIFHSPWRKRTDNLWGMGPLDNLVGLQYRMDHVENMKADVFDLITYPVFVRKGFVEDFVWRPGEHIFTDQDGDVVPVVPDTNALQANFEIQNIERLMEEMAGAPREAMGFRTPGEKTKYEVQRLENASARVYQNKIKQFEEQIIEPLLNSMLEMARRNLTGATIIKVFDNEFNVASFQALTVEDITGIGRIKPVAARHFAEQAELVQNLTNLTSSGLWPTVQPHFSGKKLAKIVQHVFNLDDHEVYTPFVAIAEQAEGQKLANSMEEQVVQEMGTASGMGEDYDLDAVDQAMAQQQTPPAEEPQ